MGSLVIGALVTSAVVVSVLLVVGGYWYLVSPISHIKGTYRFTPAGLSAGQSIEVGLAVSANTRPDQIKGWLLLLLLLYEDDLFFVHRGINTREVVNRVREYLKGQSRLKGGSSLTQQLVKHVFNPTRRRKGLRRWFEKLYEVTGALKMERTFSKEEIATLYLSSVRLGPHPLFGIAQASQTYFHKRPDQLELHEALFLLSFIPRPVPLFYHIVCERDVKQFPYRTAFIKCMDLNRLILLSFGWGALDMLETVSYRDARKIALGMQRYNPNQLPPEFELALEQRAIMEVAKLERLVESMATTDDPEIQRLAQLTKV